MNQTFVNITIFILDTLLKDEYDNPISRKDYLTFIEYFEKRLSVNINETFESVELNADYERNRWGRIKFNNKTIRKFTHIVHTLKKHNIITSTGYLVNEHSKRYSYTEAFLNAITYTNIQFIKEEINDKLYENLKSTKYYDETNPQYQLIKSDRFALDTNKCIEFIIKSYDTEFKSKNSVLTNLKRILDINNKEIFTVRINNGRVYTSFSSLKRELRKYCTIDGVALESLDLKSSQPYLLIHYLKSKYPDSIGIKRLYDILVNDDIYDWIIKKCDEELSYHIKSRDDCKILMFSYIFKKTNKGNDKVQKLFKKIFPDVYEIISKERKIFMKQNTTLADYLQSLEAEIFIPVCEKYVSRGCLSVHDSLYFVPGLRGEIEEDLKKSFLEKGYKEFKLR